MRRIWRGAAFWWHKVTGKTQAAAAPLHRRTLARDQMANGQYCLNSTQLRALLLAAGSQRDRTLLRLLTETGLRRNEAAALQREDIDVRSNVLLVRNGKGNKSRLVPLTAGLLNDLLSLADTGFGEFLFRSRQGGRLSCRQVNRIVAGIGTRAGIANPNPKHRQLTCHLLRHTFARLWKRHGGSIESLSRILGHSSVKTTWDVYGTESLEDITRNYRKTTGKMFGQKVRKL